MKLLGFAHLTIFSIDNCRPDSLPMVSSIKNLSNSVKKKDISVNFQKTHNIDIYDNNYKIEIISYPNQNKFNDCKSKCRELFTHLSDNNNVIYSPNFNPKFLNSLSAIFSLNQSEDNFLTIPLLNKRKSIKLMCDMKSQSFHTSLGGFGLNSLAFYVNDIDVKQLNDLGYKPVTDIINLSINSFSYQIIFLNM